MTTHTHDKRTTMATAIKLFLSQDRFMRESGKSTARNYSRSLSTLLEITQPEFQTGRLRAAHIDLAMAKLRRGDSPSERAERRANDKTPRTPRSNVSLDLDRSAFRGFVKYLHAQGMLNRDYNPTSDLQHSKHSERQAPKMVIKHAKFEPLLFGAGDRHPRDRMTCALGLYLLCRESEIRMLQFKDVDLDEGYIQVFMEKVDKPMKFPISTELERELYRWMSWLITHYGEIDPEWYVVPARVQAVRGKRGFHRMNTEWPVWPAEQVAQGGLAYDIQVALKSINVKVGKGEGCHTLRRSGACALEEIGTPIEEIRAWLGHADTKTTLLYLRHNPDEVKLRERYAGREMFPGGAVHKELVTGQVVNLADARRRRAELDRVIEEAEVDRDVEARTLARVVSLR
jgi:integrase